MRTIRKYLVTAGLTVGLALAGAVGAAGTASATESAPVGAPAAEMGIQAEGWVYVARQNIVFSEYGGPTSIGSTAEEWIYLYCQHNGIWGWQSYAWVPSLNDYGWLRNGDITGFTNPIPWLNVC